MWWVDAWIYNEYIILYNARRNGASAFCTFFQLDDIWFWLSTLEEDFFTNIKHKHPAENSKDARRGNECRRRRRPRFVVWRLSPCERVAALLLLLLLLPQPLLRRRPFAVTVFAILLLIKTTTQSELSLLLLLLLLTHFNPSIVSIPRCGTRGTNTTLPDTIKRDTEGVTIERVSNRRYVKSFWGKRKERESDYPRA